MILKIWGWNCHNFVHLTLTRSHCIQTFYHPDLFSMWHCVPPKFHVPFTASYTYLSEQTVHLRFRISAMNTAYQVEYSTRYVTKMYNSYTHNKRCICLNWNVKDCLTLIHISGTQSNMHYWSQTLLTFPKRHCV